jgi:3-hydroxyisobutyrate dehydrogenase
MIPTAMHATGSQSSDGSAVLSSPSGSGLLELPAICTIAWIGAGVMGRSMAGHLLAKGHRVRITTRTPSTADDLVARGATRAATPAEAADGADVAISMVGFPSDVEAVHLGPEGTLAARRLPRILVDMTTSRPSLAVDLERRAAERGVAALDAPVSGGDVGARNATLSIMVGGGADAFEALRPILAAMGATIVRQGPAGSGQHTKMVNQILIASSMLGMVEGLMYAIRAGLDPTSVLASVGGGAAGSWTIQNLAPRVLRGDFNPGFFVEHFVKDLSIALEEADRMRLDLPALALARRMYQHVVDDGNGRLGTQALYLALARRNGLG